MGGFTPGFVVNRWSQVSFLLPPRYAQAFFVIEGSAFPLVVDLIYTWYILPWWQSVQRPVVLEGTEERGTWRVRKLDTRCLSALLYNEPAILV